jgi:thymidylate kinase
MKVYVGELSGSKVVVEVIGQGGVGKSHLLGVVAHKLQLHDLELPPPKIEVGRALRSLHYSYVRFGLRSDKRKLARWLHHRSRIADRVARAENGLFVVDEGLFQLAFVSLAARVDVRRLQRLVVDVLSMSEYRPDVLLSLRASPEVVKHRRASRNRIKEKSLDLGSITREHDIYRANRDYFRATVDAIGCDFIELDVSSDEGAETARSEIQSLIQRHLQLCSAR